MSPAYATDLLRRRFLGKALPLVGTMNWISGVVGFAGAGYVLDRYGAASLYGFAALASFIGMMILAFLPASLRPRSAMPVPEKKEALQPTGG
jgi:MFS family permease